MTIQKTSRAQLTVDELTFYVHGLFASDLMLKSLIVAGEIAEFKKHTSGHCYFTLLGKESRVACAIFKQYTGYLPQWPENGDSVLVEGSVGVYSQRGVYQLYARRIVPVGAGAIDRARQELKERLNREGIFRPELKRPIPGYPARVAVVTSATGAALRDVLRVSSRRYPLCEVLIVPAQVQGLEAPDELARAFSRVASMEGVDCVLLVRGGGSREDLVPFDDERVVRAVRGCPFPVVTGLGHEVDETLCDLASDLRASTPSAAAELVFPDRNGVVGLLEQAHTRMVRAIERRLMEARNRSREISANLSSRFARRLSEAGEELSARFRGLSSGMRLRLAEAGNALSVRSAALNALSPLASLERGFVTCERDGRRLLSVREIVPGDELEVRFSDGKAVCVADLIKEEGC
ncbi:MAG: exodeoxyribonuclease VII large subunit [Fretibacterium sp.]|nr:exodeoxyribonuclease VII large subunit [Fretibacterium sp.]